MWMTRDWRLFLGDTAAYVVFKIAGLTAVLLLAERFDGIGPWSKHQIVFMLAYAMLVYGILNTFFGFNVLAISRRLGRGQLDHTLIQPQPLWVTLLTEGFSPFDGGGTIVLGLGLMVWAVKRLQLPLTLPWTALLCVSVLSSCTVVCAYSFLFGSLAFWAPRAAEEISSTAVRVLEKLKPFPLDGIGPVLSVALLTVVPSGLVAWLPCRYLLGISTDIRQAWITPVAALVFAVLAAAVFRLGMKHYGQTGSQRYTGFGHRC